MCSTSSVTKGVTEEVLQMCAGLYGLAGNTKAQLREGGGLFLLL